MRQGTRPIHYDDDPCEEAAELVEDFIEEYADRQKQIGEMLEQTRRLTEQLRSGVDQPTRQSGSRE